MPWVKCKQCGARAQKTKSTPNCPECGVELKIKRGDPIDRLTNRPNALGQHKYRTRYTIPGDTTKRQLTMWADSKDEVKLEVAKLRGELKENTEHGITWQEAHKIWWEKLGCRMNLQYQKDYDLIINQFTMKKYEVSAIAKGGKGGGRDNGFHNTKTVLANGWGVAAELPVVATTAHHLSNFMDWRRDQRVDELQKHGAEITKTTGNSAANKARMILLALARSLQKEGVLPSRPFDFEGVPKRAHRRKKSSAIALPELNSYLDVLPNEARLIVEWMLFTGWRSTAACSLRECDINAKKKVATVREKSAPGEDPKIIKCALDETLFGLLDNARKLKDEKGITSQYIFVNTSGAKWNKDSIYQRCADRWKAAGLKHHKIHELRTTFGTEAHKNFTPADVQAALNHDNIESTARYKDMDHMRADEVGQTVRRTMRVQMLQAEPKNPQKPAGTRKTPKAAKVEILCPELGAKCLISKKKALMLFGIKA